MNIRKQLLTPLAFRSMIAVCFWGILLGLLPSTLLAQSPAVKGSFPRDGSKDLLRNAFVSAGLVLPNEVGIDLSSLNDTTVRLYPTQYPDSLVPALVTTDVKVKNLTLEPIGVLEPNTSYTFEVTNGLMDEEGEAFNPYKITFTTGEIALKKHITLEKERLKKEEESTPVTVFQRDSMVGQDLDRLIEAATGQLVTLNEPIQIEDSVEVTAKDSALLAAAIAKDVVEKAKPSDSTAVESPKVPEKAKIKKKKSTNVAFPKKILAQDSKLPIHFKLPKREQVRIMIRSSVGTVVKRRGGVVDAGKQQISVSLKGIPAGTYTVYLIAGKEKVSQKILVK